MGDPCGDDADIMLAADGAAKRKRTFPRAKRIAGSEGRERSAMKKRIKADAEPAPSPSAKAMMTWLSARGAFIDGIDVEVRGGAGRCLVAARDLPGGAVILRLPPQCALSPESCVASPLGCKIKEKHLLTATPEDEDVQDNLANKGVDADAQQDEEEEQERVTHRSVLYAVLMAAPEDDAHCGPFLAHLRAGMCGTPYTWSADDRARLPLEVSKEIESYEAHIVGQYNTLFPGLCEAFPEAFPASTCTEASWRLAHSIYTSHAFLADPKKQDCGDAQEADGVLLPLLDCMNHDSEAANVEWLGLGLEEGCGARVTRPVAKGEELLYSYGCKGNAQLTIGYGFAIWDNDHDIVNLRFDLHKYLDPSHSEWPAAAARLEAVAELDGVELRGAGDISVSITQEDLDEACDMAHAMKKANGKRSGLMPQKLTAAAVACTIAQAGTAAASSVEGSTGEVQILTPAALKLLRGIMLKKGEILMRKCRGSAMGTAAWSRYERAVRKTDCIKVGSHDCAASPEGCAVALRTAQLQVLVAALDLLQEEEREAMKTEHLERKQAASPETIR